MNKNKNYSRLFITNHASKRKVEWNTENIESVEKYYWPRILFTTEVFFSAEGEIKTFSEKKKKKKSSQRNKSWGFIGRSFLQAKIKDVLKERKNH